MREPRRAQRVGAALVLIALGAMSARVLADGRAPALRSRIATLSTSAEAAGAAELVDHARRALVEADERRARSEPEAAERAEAIADAALLAAERRVEAHRARSDREVARARLRDLRARVEAAEAALAAAHAQDAASRNATSSAAPASSGMPEGARE